MWISDTHTHSDILVWNILAARPQPQLQSHPLCTDTRNMLHFFPSPSPSPPSLQPPLRWLHRAISILNVLLRIKQILKCMLKIIRHFVMLNEYRYIELLLCGCISGLYDIQLTTILVIRLNGRWIPRHNHTSKVSKNNSHAEQHQRQKYTSSYGQTKKNSSQHIHSVRCRVFI